MLMIELIEQHTKEVDSTRIYFFCENNTSHKSSLTKKVSKNQKYVTKSVNNDKKSK